MAYLKKYKGLNIYINEDGIFYCNLFNNTNSFCDTSIKSNLLDKLQEELDVYEGEFIKNGKVFLYLDGYTFIEIKELKKIGDIIYFNDGSSNIDREELYPVSITELPEFNETLVKFDKMQKIEIKIKELEFEYCDIKSTLPILPYYSNPC